MASAKQAANYKKVREHDPAGPVYFFGLIGAAVYYISIADGFGEVIVAFLKAIVWPAFFVYEVLKYVAA